jgi:hypothetical protein
LRHESLLTCVARFNLKWDAQPDAWNRAGQRVAIVPPTDACEAFTVVDDRQISMLGWAGNPFRRAFDRAGRETGKTMPPLRAAIIGSAVAPESPRQTARG